MLLLLIACRGCAESGPPPDTSIPDTGLQDEEPGWSPFDIPEINTEPNDTPETAIRLNYGTLDVLEVGGDDDPVDWFVLQAGQAGTLSTFAYQVSDPDAEVVVTIYDADLSVLDKGLGEVGVMKNEPRDWYVAVESDVAVTLFFGVNFDVVDPAIDEVSPGSAQPLEWLTVTGEDFGIDEDALVAFVGGAVSEVRLVDEQTLEVLVPYGAMSDDVRVRVAGKDADASFSLDEIDRPDIEWDEPTSWDTTSDGVEWAEDRLVIDMTPESTEDDLADVLVGIDHEVVGWGPSINLWQVRLLALAGVDVLEALAEDLLQDSRVERIGSLGPLESDGLKLDSDPYPTANATYAGLHSAVSGTGLADAWRLYNSMGGTPLPAAVRVAALDTGLLSAPTTGAWSGEEFPDESMAGFSSVHNYIAFTAGGTELKDRADWFNNDAHGTGVAGVIGAQNGRGVGNGHGNGALSGFDRAGVDDDSDGTVDEDSESMPFIVDSYAKGGDGVAVALPERMTRVGAGAYAAINMSFGHYHVLSPGESIPEMIAIESAPDTVWVTSAGNWRSAGVGPTKNASRRMPAMFGSSYPAHVITVGAANRVGSTAGGGSFSGWSTVADDPTWYTFGGTPVTVIAQEEYLAPWDSPTHGSGAYKLFDGTSACAPEVTALVGFIRAHRPDLSASFVTALVRGSGTDLISAGIANWTAGPAVPGVANPLPAPTSAKRIHWTKLLMLELILESPYLEVDTEPYLVVGNDDDVDGYLRRVPLDPTTGLWNATDMPVDSVLQDCRNPVAVEATPDGLRLAAVCSDTDTVEVWSLLGWSHVGSVELSADVGAHGRATMTPDGLLVVPVQGFGQIHADVIDVARVELLDSVDIGVGSEVFGSGLLDTTGLYVGILTSDRDPGFVQVVQLDGPGESFTHDAGNSLDLSGSYAAGVTPNGFALHPDGEQLAVTYSGTPNTDLELVMLEVQRNVSEQFTGLSAPADQDFYMRVGSDEFLIPLEKPYDASFEPLDGDYLAAAAWDSAELVILENVGGGATYAENWETAGTYTIKYATDGSDSGYWQRPENVEWLDNGVGLYMTASNEQSVSFATFSPFSLDVMGDFDATYAGGGGFYNPQGIDALPLVSIVHPRANTLVGGALEPVVMLREDGVTQIDCSLNGTTNTTSSSYGGFATCPPFNTQGFASGSRSELVVTVTAPSGTYSTSIWLDF